MNKSCKATLFAISITVLFSSCATVFGGRVSECQRHRPSPKEPTRKIRVVALVADLVLWWPGLGIDFLTGAIYRPCRHSREGTMMGSGNKGYIPDDDENDKKNPKTKGDEVND
jgi:hypothetical protein